VGAYCYTDDRKRDVGPESWSLGLNVPGWNWLNASVYYVRICMTICIESRGG
jgi:hypothetical protein